MFQEYFERGLSVIPIKKQDKLPLIKEWSRYCIELPTQTDVSTWDFRHKIPGNSNIGLCCGPASGVVALDIDTDDKAILDLCPPSPVRRRGKKGEVRFFKWREGITSHKIGGIIDVLSVGKQVVLPPSIHPEGMPYRWLTQDTLENMNAEDLPDIDFSFAKEVEKIAPAIQEKMGIKNGGEGRHDKLIKMLYAGIINDQGKDELIEQVIAYDKENHQPPYFDDPQNTRGTGKKAAEKLYQSVLKGAEKQGKVSMDNIKPQEVVIVREQPVINLEIPKRSYMKLPHLPGIGAEIFKNLYENSPIPRTQMCFASTLATMSVVVGNNMFFRGTGCNLYLLVAAPSASGKGSSFDRCRSLLYDAGLSNRLGTGSPTSETAIFEMLEMERVRLCGVNEATKMFKQMGEYSLEDCLTDLFDGPGKFMINKQKASKDPKNPEIRGGVFSPQLTLYMVTTINGFSEFIKPRSFEGGFASRPIYFFEDRPKLPRELKNYNAPWPKEIAEEIKAMAKSRYGVVDASGPKDKFDPISLKESPEIEALYSEIFARYGQELMRNFDSPFSAVYARKNYQFNKFVVLHHAMMHGREYLTKELSPESLLWAEQAITAIIHNEVVNLDDNVHSSKYSKDSTDMLLYIRKNCGKKDGITLQKISRRFKGMRPKERDEILEDLLAQGKITKNQDRKFYA